MFLDSDKLSSEAEKSDDYDPADESGRKKKLKMAKMSRHKDSDSDDDPPAITPSPPKPVRRKRPVKCFVG